MENDIRWPKSGDNPFSVKGSNYNSPTWCSLEWLNQFNLEDSDYSSVYKKAGDIIVTDLEKGESWEKVDRMFFPIAYLYRHCFELKLKSVIRKGIDLNIVEIKGDKYAVIMESHNLHIIWNLFKSIILKHWPTADVSPVVGAEKVILAFHEVDQTGQNLKYARDKKGNKTTLSLPKSAELTNLRDTVESVYNLLDGCESEFAYCREMRDEINAENGGNY